MPEALGRSLYLSESHGIPADLGQAGVPVFLSLHREEEMNEDWKERMVQFCEQLHARGCRILADISKRTLAAMQVPSVSELSRMLHLWAVRTDYGFTLEEIKAIAEELPVVLNASVLTEAEMQELQGCRWKMAMHNFYPRPETGLDAEYLKERTDLLHQYGFKVLAFIPGTGNKRGPLKEGLPTLEAHRALPPLCAYADLVLNFGIDQVYVGDPELEESERKRICRLIDEGILEVPCTLRNGYEDLYEQVFTNRPDSPRQLIRAAESREYSVSSQRRVKPAVPECRRRGTITMDNEKYLRYEGELMIVREDFPADERVNVIGAVKAEYLSLTDWIPRGGKFRLTR